MEHASQTFAGEAVEVYVTRPHTDHPELVEVLVHADARGPAFYRLPSGTVKLGEHPCEAADRLVTAILAEAMGPTRPVSATFAYRKLRGQATHTFVTEAGVALPDRMGDYIWIIPSWPTPWS